MSSLYRHQLTAEAHPFVIVEPVDWVISSASNSDLTALDSPNVSSSPSVVDNVYHIGSKNQGGSVPASKKASFGVHIPIEDVDDSIVDLTFNGMVPAPFTDPGLGAVSLTGHAGSVEDADVTEGIQAQFSFGNFSPSLSIKETIILKKNTAVTHPSLAIWLTVHNHLNSASTIYLSASVFMTTSKSNRPTYKDFDGR